MTISATYSPAQASGNGATVAFPFTFKVFSQTDLTVILTSSAGVNTTQAITTDYTVSINADQNNNPGGTVTMLTAPATGETLIITRVLEEIQETDIANGGGFYPEVLEDALDRLTMLNQQNTATTNRALVAPLAEASIDTLPSIADRASKYLAFDADGNPVAVAGTTNAFVVSAFAETLLDDGTAAAMRATIDVPSNTDLDLAEANTAGQFNNLGIAASVASFAVTIALKGADGNDPSASNPVRITFRSATAATGTTDSIEVTSAKSITIPDGATLGVFNTNYSRAWLVAINNAGSVELAVACLVGLTGSLATGEFKIFQINDGDEKISTTSIGTGADALGTWYSTTGRSNVAFTVLAAIDLVGAGHYTAVSHVHVNPNFRPGDVVSSNVAFNTAVDTGVVAIPDDDTLPQITEGDEYLTLSKSWNGSATPNIHMIEAVLNYAHSAAVVVTAALFINGETDSRAAAQNRVAAVNAQAQLRLFHMFFTDETAGSSPTTYAIRAGGSTGPTMTLNGVAGAGKMANALFSFLRVAEISA